uniref:Cytochrome b5-related protein n=1 Tax=Anoplophora glabripennis TaxID=217634 RepID=V5GUE1_ANOGL
MPPQSDFVPKSSLGIVPPATRSRGYALTVDVWLNEKQDTDGAEGLWRIHDGIYDLQDFIEKHPGGSDWISITKGTDITEAFEVHHLTSLSEELMKKYFVREAKSKRNFPFTFKEDGFYRTLKREVNKVVKTLPKQSPKTSDFLIDAMVVLLFTFSVMAVRYWSFWLGILAGLFLGLVTVAAHNYIHRKDNLRMYYFQFSLMQVREFRIVHVLSHHLLTNTIDDLEISLLEPLLKYLPIDKTPLKRYTSWFMAPLVWFTFFHSSLVRRLIDAHHFNCRNLKLTDLTALILPAVMYFLGGQSLFSTFIMWNFIIVVGSCHFTFVALHAAHHHPEIFHDGDSPRSQQGYDWGLSQLDALMERKETTGSQFMVLTNFGDHCLHHMFPTLDHGSLEHLYPIFNDVLDKYGVNLRMISQWDAVIGGFQQLVRVEPNSNPPDLKKNR